MDDLSDSEEVPNETRRGSTVRRRIGVGIWISHRQCATKNQNPNTGLCHHWGGFLLVRFLWPFKENELACPGETGLKIQFAIAIQIKRK